MDIENNNLIYIRKSNTDGNIIIIGRTRGNLGDNKYELIGINKGQNQIQTIFNINDEFIKALNAVQTYNIVMSIVYEKLNDYKTKETWEDIKILIIELSNTIDEISKGIDNVMEYNEIYRKLYELIA